MSNEKLTQLRNAYIHIFAPLKMDKMLINKEIVGKILIVAGFTLFLIGTLFLGGSAFDQWVCALGWFFGMVLFVGGLVLNFRLFTMSKGGLGVVLISISAVLIITALVFFSFTISNIRIVVRTEEVFLKGVPVPNVFITQTRPYEWFLRPLLEAGLFLFVAGLLLKLYDDVF